MGAKRVSPFSNGSQYGDWRARNCDRCWKDYDPEKEVTRCCLEKAISLACVSDGTISATVARRIGMPDDRLVYSWDCPEREETRPKRQRKAPPIAQGQGRLL